MGRPERAGPLPPGGRHHDALLRGSERRPGACGSGARLYLSLTGSAQCVLGTVIDAYYRGYDCIMVEDCVATTSPPGGLENVLYNAGGVSVPCRRLWKSGLSDGNYRATASLRTLRGSLTRVHEWPPVVPRMTPHFGRGRSTAHWRMDGKESRKASGSEMCNIQCRRNTIYIHAHTRDVTTRRSSSVSWKGISGWWAAAQGRGSRFYGRLRCAYT